jgi:hypothetical protein
MKLWLLEQDTRSSYDTYDSCVVVADTLEDARDMAPSWADGVGFELLSTRTRDSRDWAEHAGQVTVTLLGEATDPTRRMVCASFNAG